MAIRFIRVIAFLALGVTVLVVLLSMYILRPSVRPGLASGFHSFGLATALSRGCLQTRWSQAELTVYIFIRVPYLPRIPHPVITLLVRVGIVLETCFQFLASVGFVPELLTCKYPTLQIST